MNEETQLNESQALKQTADNVLASVQDFIALTGEIEIAITHGLATLEAQKLSAVAHIDSAKTRALAEINVTKSTIGADNPNFQHPKDLGYSSDFMED